MAERVGELCEVRRAQGCAMIQLRGAPEVLAGPLRDGLGLDVPPVRRRVGGDGGLSALWMSPDEVLVLVPEGAATQIVARLEAALSGQFALVVDVSDARVIFDLRGAGWRETLARLCPVDFAPDAFGPDDLRRTRAGQVAALIWCIGAEEARIACARSVAGYMQELLETAARGGAETGLYGPVGGRGRDEQSAAGG